MSVICLSSGIDGLQLNGASQSFGFYGTLMELDHVASESAMTVELTLVDL